MGAISDTTATDADLVIDTSAVSRQDAVAAVLTQIGKGPNGRAWDCKACGFQTCQRFADDAARERRRSRDGLLRFE